MDDEGPDAETRAVQERFLQLERLLSEPGALQDAARRRELLREHARLEPAYQKAQEVTALGQDLAAARALLEESGDDAGWLRDEVAALRNRLEEARAELRRLLLPRDPADERDVIVELRAGAGGEEAALFVADLVRMYARYAERMGWKTEVLSTNETELGGFREIILEVVGKGAYSRLKFEAGVHRVQRVPVTEAGGRIHTSTATVAVLPEPDEVEVQIRPEDLEIDTFRSSGAGGQHVNRTDSAVRITHRPTGIVVTCQDERSQIKNRARAMTVLRARLYGLRRQQQEEAVASDRRAQVGTGERSERIRTYNFPQNRVTDERIDLTLYQLREVLDGQLELLVEPLLAAEQTRLLQQAAVV